MKMKMKMKMCLILVICMPFIASCLQTCHDDSDCPGNKSCYCQDTAMLPSCYCLAPFYQPTNLNWTRNWSIPNEHTYYYNLSGYNMTYYDKSPSIECEKEWMIKGNEYWGYDLCVRCKDTNLSVWEDIIPSGQWIC